MKCHQTVELFSKPLVSLCAALVVSGVLALADSANAQNLVNLVTMNDGGSTATINTTQNGTMGMNSWTVLGGQNQLNQQWFWYSINGGAAAPITQLGNLNVVDNGYGLSGLNDVTVTYGNAQLSASIEYVLSGNGVSSGSADLQEYITIVNPLTSGQAVNLSFYQYSNFNLLMNNNNSVSIAGSPAGGFNGATQTTGGPGGNGIAEVIDAPYANYAEAASVSPIPQTLNELNSGSYYTLNDTTSAGPGNVSWAFQWNALLNPGDTLNITKDKGLSIQIVPEPSILSLIALGTGALGLVLRRKLA
jgi:hypothetical protein